jgi:CDGSH-type Zn-finger protein
MTNPTIAQKGPYATSVSAGAVYWWCACGKSKKQPFCDGTHQGSSFVPVKYEANKDGTIYFCGCKSSGQAPLCDGSHQRL